MSRKAPPQKEAVVFILDAFPSMNAPYPMAKQTTGSTNSNTAMGDNEDNDNSSTKTRLDCAKQAIESMLFDMMLNSRSDSKALVIVTKTKKTRHHFIALDEDPDAMSPAALKFPNLTEVGWKKHGTLQEQVMRAPDFRMIRHLWKIKSVASMERAESLQGDICDALILAADALFRCAYENKKGTSAKTPYRYRRKIVLLTDACHQVVLDMSQVCLIIDNLRKMECPLHVLGMGFGLPSVEFDNPLEESAAKPRLDIGGDADDGLAFQHPDRPSAKKVKKKLDVEDDLDLDDNNNNSKDDNKDDNKDDTPRPDHVPSANNNDSHNVTTNEAAVAGQFIRVYETCQDREQLLGSISEKTGGSVTSMASMQELLDAKVGKRFKKGAPRNIQLHVGPGMTVSVKSLKLLVPEAGPKIIEHAAMMDDRGMPKMNGIGQEMTEPIKKAPTYWRHKRSNQGEVDGGGSGEEDQEGENPEDELSEVGEDDIANAVRYGKDLIPWGEQDKAGLKVEEDCGYEDSTFDAENPYIHILGYVRRDSIPYRYLVGPPYGISGGFSKKACTVVAALSRTLKKSDFVAFCTFKVSKTGIPSLAGLFPFEEGDQTNRLLLFKLPFCDDVKCFGLEGFHEILELQSDQEDENEKSQSSRQSPSKESKAQASDALVDSLMLPDDAICSGKIPSPFMTSFNKTILKRAISKRREISSNDIVAMREQLDLMAIPSDVFERTAPALEEFRRALPLKKKKAATKTTNKGGGRGGGRKNPTYTDWL